MGANVRYIQLPTVPLDRTLSSLHSRPVSARACQPPLAYKLTERTAGPFILADQRVSVSLDGRPPSSCRDRMETSGGSSAGRDHAPVCLAVYLAACLSVHKCSPLDMGPLQASLATFGSPSAAIIPLCRSHPSRSLSLSLSLSHKLVRLFHYL